MGVSRLCSVLLAQSAFICLVAAVSELELLGLSQLPSLVPPGSPPTGALMPPPMQNLPTSQGSAGGLPVPVPVPGLVPGQQGQASPPVPAPPAPPAAQGQQQAQPASGPPKKPTGWLATAGSYTVEKLDRSSRRGTAPLQEPVNKFLLHTIEGTGGNGDWEGGTATLDRTRYWPHFIVAKDRSGKTRIGQYLPLEVAGFALAGNNNKGAIQVEIGGKAGKPFTNTDQDLTSAVAALWKALNQASNGGIPLACPVAFKDDNGAYGAKASTRLTPATFAQTAGLVGHQHSPAPDTHWDPGAINCQALATAAGGVATSQTGSAPTAQGAAQPQAPAAQAQAPAPQGVAAQGQAQPQCDSAGLANCQKYGGGHACFRKFPGCLGNQAAACNQQTLEACLAQGKGQACWAESGCQQPAQQAPAPQPTTATPTAAPVAAPSAGSGSGAGSGADAGECPGAADWKQVLANPNIQFLDSHVSGLGVGDGATAADNARDAAAGKKVKTSKYGHAGGKTTCLDPGMPKFLLAVAAKGKVKVNSMAGSKHGDGSAHYRGLAADVGEFDGKLLTTGYSGTTTVINACRASGASKVGHNSLGWSGHQTWVHCRFK